MIVDDLAALATPIEKLDVLDGNPRRGDVDAIARSLGAFGQRKPVVARRDGTVIAGNHTLLAARSLGWDQLAVVWVDDDDTTAHAFALADNRTAELGDYDEAALLAMVAEVHDADADLLTAAGWSGDDLEALLGRLDTAPPAPDVDPDEVPDAPPPCTQRGDVWMLGPHRLMCGDCRDADDVKTLLAGATVNLAFTSPPYAEQRAYDESSGFRPIPPDEYVEWFAAVAANVEAHLAADGSWFVNIRAHCDGGQRHLYTFDLVTAHVRQWRWMFVDDLCWRDTKNGVPGGWPNRFKDAWEPVYHFARQAQIAFNPLANGTATTQTFDYSPTHGRTATGSGLLGEHPDDKVGVARPSNVIEVASSSASGHAAAFPVGLPQWFAKAYSDPGDNVYDPFLGSGSTLIAAHLEDRIGFGMELSAGYCDVACRRFQRLTGQLPVLESTGEPHDFGDAP
jgi:DNA modification methylase